MNLDEVYVKIKARELTSFVCATYELERVKNENKQLRERVAYLSTKEEDVKENEKETN